MEIACRSTTVWRFRHHLPQPFLWLSLAGRVLSSGPPGFIGKNLHVGPADVDRSMFVWRLHINRDHAVASMALFEACLSNSFSGCVNGRSAFIHRVAAKASTSMPAFARSAPGPPAVSTIRQDRPDLAMIRGAQRFPPAVCGEAVRVASAFHHKPSDALGLWFPPVLAINQRLRASAAVKAASRRTTKV